jgi:hypothetical protein
MSILWYGMNTYRVAAQVWSFVRSICTLASMDCSRDKLNATFSDLGQFLYWLGKCMFQCMAPTPRSCCTTAICQRRQERHYWGIDTPKFDI